MDGGRGRGNGRSFGNTRGALFPELPREQNFQGELTGWRGEGGRGKKEGSILIIRLGQLAASA